MERCLPTAPLGKIGIALVIAMLATTESAPAQRLTKSRLANSEFDWSGIYAGGHVGYARGKARTGISELIDENADPLSDAPAPPPTEVSDRFRSPIGSLIGGVQVGYNYV